MLMLGEYAGATEYEETMNRSIGIFASVALALCVAKSASANFLYDISTDFGGIVTHVEFTEPTILTSFTTVSSFLLATSSDSTVANVVLDPIASGTCPPISLSAPCLTVNLANGDLSEFSGFPVYTSVGTFVQVDGDATIRISAVPEPSSMLLLLAALGGAVVMVRQRRRSAPL
jgi:hypothetical protein